MQFVLWTLPDAVSLLLPLVPKIAGSNPAEAVGFFLA
jgi:hypothetical protein